MHELQSESVDIPGAGQTLRKYSMSMKSQIAPADIPSIAGRLRVAVQWLRQHFLLWIAAPIGLALAPSY
jgi:hypothetical protein